MYLSWIIPAYNEEKRIGKTLREVDTYLRSKNFNGGYEIIVVDSFSKDRTGEIVKNLQSQISNLQLLVVENKGKGWAVNRGMLKGAGETRLFADADNSVSPEHLDNFLPFLCASEKSTNCFDVIIGSIEIPGAQIEEQAQWYRRALGRLAKYVIRIVAGLWEIHDSQRGFKVFSRYAAEFIFAKQEIMSWGFDIEILVIAKTHGFGIKELPVKWINPPDSKVGLSSYLTTFGELLRIKLNKIKGVYD